MKQTRGERGSGKGVIETRLFYGFHSYLIGFIGLEHGMNGIE